MHLEGQGSVHDGPFKNLLMTGARVKAFDDLWNNNRYTKANAPKNRLTCPTFEQEMNVLLKNVMDAEFPMGVVRRSGHIGSSDVIMHYRHFRAVLARLDAEDE
ncbi:MAG: hypothetical protein AAB663_02695 [Patescibacteria group bacterium]